MASAGMEAHVKRISRQDKIATVILTAIVGLVIAMLVAIVLYILASGVGQLFDISFFDGQATAVQSGWRYRPRTV